MQKSQRKRRRTKRSVFCILLVILFVWIDGNFNIKDTNETIFSNKVSQDIKIVLISDLHGSIYGKNNRIIIKKIKNASPDLIFILGDMYSKNQQNDIDRTIELLKNLSDITDTYVITGDHDIDKIYKEKLKETDNFKYLSYDKSDIEIKNTKISIYGIDNVYFSDSFNLLHEFDSPDPSRLNILLSHIPSIDKLKSLGVDIIFSGDTHGGMIRLPFFGATYYDGYILPKITYSGIITDKGLYKFDSTSLFVTSGLGNYPLPLRFNNRPEICTITISKGE